MSLGIGIGHRNCETSELDKRSDVFLAESLPLEVIPHDVVSTSKGNNGDKVAGHCEVARNDNGSAGTVLRHADTRVPQPAAVEHSC